MVISLMTTYSAILITDETHLLSPHRTAVIPNGDEPVHVDVAEEDQVPIRDGYAIGW